MGKIKNRDVGNRAWSLLRLALLWANKGGVFKRRLMMELRLVPKLIKNIGHNNNGRDDHHHRQLRYYGERELSFDKTPVTHVKMHRPASMRYLIPCIGPQVDFDYDFDGDDDDDDGVYGYDHGRKSFLKNGEGEEEYGYDDNDDSEQIVSSEEEEEGIDSRAEEFIANFYQQMKMQRQISYLEYNDMLNRSSG